MLARARVLALLGLLAGCSLSTPVSQAGAASLLGQQGTSSLHVTPQGAITQLAVDPEHVQTLYAATDAAGVYRSDNGGATWVSPGKGLPPATSIAGLSLDPTRRGVVYAATAKGVYKTMNGGATWASQGPPTALGSTSLAMDPLAPNTLYAGTAGDGIYRSTNGGTTWAAIGPRLAAVQVVVTDPLSGTTIYAGTDDGLLFSTEAGVWRRAGLGHVSVQALGISAANTGILYVGTGAGMLVSRDAGVSWARAGLRDISITTIYVDPRQPRTVYAASSEGRGIYRTYNGGHDWRPLVAGLSSGNVHALAIDPTDPTTAYAGLEHGVFKSLQAGVSWASSSIYDRSVVALLQPEAPSGTYYAGTNGGVYASNDGGAVWTSAGIGNHAVSALLGVDTTLVAATEAGIYRTQDGGHTWPVTLHVRATILARDVAPGVILAGTANGLYRSSDDGIRWSKLPAGEGEVNAVLLGPKGVIYAGGSAGVVVSADDGASFKRYSVHDETVRQLLAQPDPATGAPALFARTASGHLYRSTNAAVTWTDVSVGSAPVSALTLGAQGNLYAATGQGIYRSSSRGASWILTDQQDQSLHPLVLQPALGGEPGTLLEGLDGQGVIVRTLTTTPASPFAPLANGSAGRYYASSGHFVRAPFLDWYTNHHGDAVLGLPRTEALRENGQLVQYFDNALLIYHPDLADTPQVISLAPLGGQLLGTPAPRLAPFDNSTTRRYYAQTGHSLSGEFLAFWRAYGGIDVFGLPISEPVMRNNIIVQYFQNVRFESGPTGASAFNTRLSPLGDALLKQKGWLR